MVNIPRQFNTNSMYELINDVVDKKGNPVDTNIEFNFAQLAFAKPSGVTVLSNIIEWLIKRDVEVYLSGYDMLTNPILYLDDSGFFKHYLNNPLRKDSSLRKTTAPLKLIKHSSSFSWLNYDFKSWMSNNLDLSEDYFHDVTTCLKEFFLNIKDHSGEDIGCVFMQYFPNIKEISISISDFGEGISCVVKNKEPLLSDSEAILKACEDGYSTKSTPRNRGAGLPHMINYIVMHLKGMIAIHSNCGFAKFTSQEAPYMEITNSSYPGTLFDITISTDASFIRNLREDFTW